MNENVTISSLLNSLNNETANAQKWQSKAALQATEIKRLTDQVERLRKDKIKLLADLKERIMSEGRTFKISGHPVTRQEVLDQATMIRGNTVRSIGLAVRIIREDGRDVDIPAS